MGLLRAVGGGPDHCGRGPIPAGGDRLTSRPTLVGAKSSGCGDTPRFSDAQQKRRVGLFYRSPGCAGRFIPVCHGASARWPRPLSSYPRGVGPFVLSTGGRGFRSLPRPFGLPHTLIMAQHLTTVKAFPHTSSNAASARARRTCISPVLRDAIEPKPGGVFEGRPCERPRNTFSPACGARRGARRGQHDLTAVT